MLLLLVVLALSLSAIAPATSRTVFNVAVLAPYACRAAHYNNARPLQTTSLAFRRVAADPRLLPTVDVRHTLVATHCASTYALAEFVRLDPDDYDAFIGPVHHYLCEPAARLATAWQRTAVSWGCSDTRRTSAFFTSSVGADSRAADAMAAILRHFQWKYVVIVHARVPYMESLALEMQLAVARHGGEVEKTIVMTNDTDEVIDDFLSISDKVKAIILCIDVSSAESTDLETIIQAVEESGLTKDRVAFIILETLSTFFTNEPYGSDPRSADLLREAQVNMLVFILTIIPTAAKKTYEEINEMYHDYSDIDTYNVTHGSDMSQYVTSLYDAIMMLVYALNKTMAEAPPSATIIDHRQLALNTRNLTFRALLGDASTDANGDVEFEYVLLQNNIKLDMFQTVLSFTKVGDDDHVISKVNPVIWATRGAVPPDADCVLQDVPCIVASSNEIGVVNVVITLVVALCVILIGLGLALYIRKMTLHKEMTVGPNKMILDNEDLVFVSNSKQFTGRSRSENIASSVVLERPAIMRSSNSILLSDEGSQDVVSAHSYYQDLSQIARFNGDVVHVKMLPIREFEMNSNFLRSLKLMRELRHENMNRFIGCFAESVNPGLVTEFCSRGSLMDLYKNTNIKLEWSFKLSFLTDFVRGMRYLHSSPMKLHGHLSSRNTLIDSRWVLKVTDYGLPMLYEGKHVEKSTTAKDLLWSAPELLRDTALMKKGTQTADVYAFAIICQELILRSAPFASISLTPEEIVKKLKKPPPLIRPSVSPQSAPPEAIHIMKQCWMEMPEARPTFDAIYDGFKSMSQGKKTNIVDTMFAMLEKYSNNLEEIVRERTEQLDEEKKKTDQLLYNMLPRTVADALKVGNSIPAESYEEVSIYFSDIVGFTSISAKSTPMQVVTLLNDLYTMFDYTIDQYDVYKVETIGDAYMVVSGLPIRCGTMHAAYISDMALDLLSQCGTFRIQHMPDRPLMLRIGLHSGPCVAGVVGHTMPRYCLFGDTVNTASRMESTGKAFRIHISEAVNDRLMIIGGYHSVYRGEVELKGKGIAKTFWLISKDGFSKPLPIPPDTLEPQDAAGTEPTTIAFVSASSSCSASAAAATVAAASTQSSGVENSADDEAVPLAAASKSDSRDSGNFNRDIDENELQSSGRIIVEETETETETAKDTEGRAEIDAPSADAARTDACNHDDHVTARKAMHTPVYFGEEPQEAGQSLKTVYFREPVTSSTAGSISIEMARMSSDTSISNVEVSQKTNSWHADND